MISTSSSYPYTRRALWHYYFENNDGLVFVLDSSDAERLTEAREELQSMLADDRLRDSAVLVLANKQDLERAESPANLVGHLGLDKLGQEQRVCEDHFGTR